MVPLSLSVGFLFLLLLVQQQRWSAYGLEQYRYRDLLLTLSSSTLPSSHSTSSEDVQELYVTQKLDHFDGTNDATFQQRYFVSYRHHTRKTGPVLNFLCVGGEGPGFDASVLVDSVHCSGDMLELAKRIASHNQYNVHLYALEHRYYGKSYPTFPNGESPLTIHNLKYLSSQQALEDLAHFVRSVNEETESSTTRSSLWVTFGGSYPGMMALYARYKYPHLVFAAVSSSAPINARVDFPGYKARQSWDLKYPKVGGSFECHRIVKVGHDQAVSLLQTSNNSTDGSVELASKFNVCDPSTSLQEKRNQELLLGDGLINIPAQGNDPACVGDICNIRGLCKFLIDEFANTQAEDDPPTYVELEVLAKVGQKQQAKQQQDQLLQNRNSKSNKNMRDENCLPVDFQAMLDELSKTEIDRSGWRSWLYQTCSEFGFYQTCKDDCPFALHYHQVDLDLEICRKVFNITNVYDNVKATLDRYGGVDISDGSRILSINGNVDPWSVLGLKETDIAKYSLPVKVVDGASHHFWTHAVKDTDSPEIVKVREYTYSVVMDWLEIGGTGRTAEHIS